MQEKEILEGRTMGGGERQMGKGREEEGESGQIDSLLYFPSIFKQ